MNQQSKAGTERAAGMAEWLCSLVFIAGPSVLCGADGTQVFGGYGLVIQAVAVLIVLLCAMYGWQWIRAGKAGCTKEKFRQEQIALELEQWEEVSKVAGIACFRVDRGMNVISNTGRVAEFWPLRNGNPIPPEEYLIPEDAEMFRRKYEEVFSGKADQTSMFCRVSAPGKTQCVQLYIKRTKGRPDEVSGLIHDVTDKVQGMRKHGALYTMWKNVIDALPVLFVVKNADDDYRILQANRKYAELSGLDSAMVTGRMESEFLPNPEEAERIKEGDREVVTDWVRKDSVERVHVNSGEERLFQTIRTPLKNEAGQRIVISIALDITEKQEGSEVRRIVSRALETLFTAEAPERDLRDLLKEICEFIGFDRAFIACMDEDMNGIRIYTNWVPEGATPLVMDNDMFRLENAETLPHYLKQKNAAKNRVVRLDFSDVQDRAAAESQVPIIVKHAGKFDFRGVHIQYIDAGGKPWGCLGFITAGKLVKHLSENEQKLLTMVAHIAELTISRKRTLEQLRGALHDALAADKAKSFFLSSMSHEIRTPLNAVIGFTDLLKDAELDRETRLEYLGAVEESGHALLTLLNDILELSKLNSGKAVFHREPTDLRSFLKSVEENCRPDAERKGLKLEFQTEIGTDRELVFDPSGLRQILMNLIGNAVKFTQNGGVTVKTVYRRRGAEDACGELTLKVSDTGIGINHVDQEKMFEPFIQLTRMRGTNGSGSGTGLGLVIIKKLVEQSGGQLSLRSAPGEGSCFTIVWPEVGERTGAEPETPSVLVVDGSEANLNIVKKLLGNLQVTCDTAGNGTEALRMMSKRSYTTALIELRLPDMSGTELAREIRANTPYGRTVFIAAMHDGDDAAMHDAEVFDCGMLKPVTLRMLRDCTGGGIYAKKNKAE